MGGEQEPVDYERNGGPRGYIGPEHVLKLRHGKASTSASANEAKRATICGKHRVLSCISRSKAGSERRLHGDAPTKDRGRKAHFERRREREQV